MLADGCAEAIARTGLPAHVRDFGSKGCVSYRSEPLTSYRDYLETHEDLFYASWNHVVNRGVFMTPGDEEQWTISVQHTEDDIARYVDAFGEFCDELVAS
jgi:glutamate-1-semialdehyde 2,1-aminomutase